MHPRPDQRHIRYEDVQIKELLRSYPGVELNIEEIPVIVFFNSGHQADQCTLVPADGSQPQIMISFICLP